MGRLVTPGLSEPRWVRAFVGRRTGWPARWGRRYTQCGGRPTPRCASLVLPSLPYVGADGAVSPVEGNDLIDAAAIGAGRQPQDVRRLANVVGSFGSGGDGPLTGTPATWAEQLAELTLTHGFSTFILVSDDADDLARFAGEVAPATREAVDAERTPART
jgi:hypothetical protein